MTGTDIFLIDTNLLVYYFDKADMQKHLAAKKIIDPCMQGKSYLVLSSQNLSEFFSVITSKKLLPKKDALEFLSYIVTFAGFIKINFDHATVLEAARISEEHSMHFWDALLAATMKKNSVLNLYTENKNDFKVPWLNAVNPFEKK